MSSGTKIAVIGGAVLVIAIVGYYTVFSGGGDTDTADTQPPIDPNLRTVTTSLDPDASAGSEPDPVNLLDLDSIDISSLTDLDGSSTDTDTSTDTVEPTIRLATDDPPVEVATTQPTITARATQPNLFIDDTPPTGNDTKPTVTIAVEPDSITMGQTPDDGGHIYVVQQGDLMWNIAKRELGAGSKWPIIARANPHVNPDRLKPGQELFIPRAGPEMGPIAEKTTTDPLGLGFDDDTKTVIVGEDEGLWDIAAREYGDGTKWELIYTANKDRIKNPDVIRAGMKLVVPPLPRD